MKIQSTKYILIIDGKSSVHHDKDDVLFESGEYVRGYIWDFYRHKLPLRVDEDLVRNFDVEVWELGPDGGKLLELPYQEWIDDAGQIQLTQDVEEAVRRAKEAIVEAARAGESIDTHVQELKSAEALLAGMEDK